MTDDVELTVKEVTQLGIIHGMLVMSRHPEWAQARLLEFRAKAAPGEWEGWLRVADMIVEDSPTEARDD